MVLDFIFLFYFLSFSFSLFSSWHFVMTVYLIMCVEHVVLTCIVYAAPKRASQCALWLHGNSLHNKSIFIFFIASVGTGAVFSLLGVLCNSSLTNESWCGDLLCLTCDKGEIEVRWLVNVVTACHMVRKWRQLQYQPTSPLQQCMMMAGLSHETRSLVNLSRCWFHSAVQFLCLVILLPPSFSTRSLAAHNCKVTPSICFLTATR